LRAIEAFPQKDDATNRVFADAKLSTCVFVTARVIDNGPFRCRVHPGKDIDERSPSQAIRRGDVSLYDPENQPIVACSQDDWDLATKIMGSGRLARLGDFCIAYQGEVNETTDAAKGNISSSVKDGPQILRGSNVCLYVLREASQGETMYLRKAKFLKDKRPGAKAWHHQQRRVGFQRKSPQNNFRRLIACGIPLNEFCCDSVSYIPENDARLPLAVVHGLLNSRLLEWYFRLGSTNALVNEYQFNILPAPRFADGEADVALAEEFERLLAVSDHAAAFALIEPLLAAPPFPRVVVACFERLVSRIMEIEQTRGEIARSERSALAPAAQALQDLIDRIIYRMAGLTDAEAAGLEARLARML